MAWPASTGNAGVGIALDVGVNQRNTTATIGAGTDLTATMRDILVHAEADDNLTSIALAASACPPAGRAWPDRSRSRCC
ncbi:hypothetical protein LP420_40215 [Massilia sp. B-10]|nr:hypothetical protein LP420_40215 [Massilia sp. B-10]